MEVGIRTIDIDSKNKGLLIVDKRGYANVVAIVTKQIGAKEEDVTLLMEEIKIAYVRYLQRMKGGSG